MRAAIGLTDRRRAQQLTHILAHYLHAGHEFDWDEKSFGADSALSDGEESHRIVVRDERAFWQIYQRLKYERRW